MTQRNDKTSPTWCCTDQMHAHSRAQSKPSLESVRLQKWCPWSSLEPTPNISQSFHSSSSHCKTKTSRNQLHLWERLHHPHWALWSLCHCGHTTDSYQHWVVFPGSGICYNLSPDNINQGNKSCGLPELLPETLPAQRGHPRAWSSSWYGHANNASQHKRCQKK